MNPGARSYLQHILNKFWGEIYTRWRNDEEMLEYLRRELKDMLIVVENQLAVQKMTRLSGGKHGAHAYEDSQRSSRADVESADISFGNGEYASRIGATPDTAEAISRDDFRQNLKLD